MVLNTFGGGGGGGGGAMSVHIGLVLQGAFVLVTEGYSVSTALIWILNPFLARFGADV